MWLVLPPIAYGQADPRCSFALRRARDLPKDFRPNAELREFSLGVFVELFNGELRQPTHPRRAIC